jgi:hypothetical protein
MRDLFDHDGSLPLPRNEPPLRYRAPRALMGQAFMAKLSQELRQERFDYTGRYAPTPVTRPRRLLILGCSATKNPIGTCAGELYDGPLWKTWRAADPDQQKASVAALSALYGLIPASAPIRPYNAVLDARSAARMIAEGQNHLRPHVPQDQRTATGRRRAIEAVGYRSTAYGTLLTLRNQLGATFNDVGIVGGKHYVEVARAFLAEDNGVSVDREATVTVINAEIGYMRAQLKAWLADPPEHCLPR